MPSDRTKPLNDSDVLDLLRELAGPPPPPLEDDPVAQRLGIVPQRQRDDDVE